MLEGDHHQALRYEYQAHLLQFPRSGKLHLQPCEQEQPKGISWHCMERDGKDKACHDQKLVLAGCFIHSNDMLTITQNHENPLLHSLSISCSNAFEV